MHVSADRSNATLVSIPRDTMVQIPKCVVDGKTYPASNGPQSFNKNLANGGPPCTVSTVDRMLGVQVDHYIMIDFTGVKKMTDAVDGVDMCISEPINDPVLPDQQGGTDLKLAAGDQNLSGETALKFLRARHAFGDGSDLARIKAQKAFLMALTRKLKNSASLTNVEGMFKIANIAVESLTVDRGLGGVDKLISLGNQLKKVPEKRMAFTTLPIEEYPPMAKSKVQPKQPEANNLMAMLRTEHPRHQGRQARRGTTAGAGHPGTAEGGPDHGQGRRPQRRRHQQARQRGRREPGRTQVRRGRVRQRQGRQDPRDQHDHLSQGPTGRGQGTGRRDRTGRRRADRDHVHHPDPLRGPDRQGLPGHGSPANR